MTPPTTPLPAPSLGCVPCPTRFNAEEVCTCPQASVPEQFASVPWNSFSRDMLKALYSFAPISVHCNKSTAVRFPVRKPRGAAGPSAPQAPPRTPAWSDRLRSKEGKTTGEIRGWQTGPQTDRRPAEGRTDGTARQGGYRPLGDSTSRHSGRWCERGASNAPRA